MNVSTLTALALPARNVAACAALLCAALLASLPGARQARAQGAPAAPGAAPAGAPRPARAGERKSPVAATGSISGRVVGEGGEPMPNAAVYVRPRGGVTFFRQQALGSDEEGNFVARDLDPAVYHVGAHVPGYFLDSDQPAAAGTGPYRLGDFVTLRLVRGGVITGAVTGAGGEPMVGLSVRAIRVRDQDGRPLTASPNFFEAQTDDRGVYRVYGLLPGGYVITTSGASYGWGPLSAYEGDAPTFYPSGTRDTAAEITVRPGQEVAGVDIRYREERGHRVTGTLMVPAQTSDDASVGVTVSLTYAGSGMTAANAWVGIRETERAFSLEGVADGDYEVQAQFQTREGLSGSSPPQRVAVRGADVAGLKLALAPLASVSGTLVAEPAPEAVRALEACKERAPTARPQETLVVARRDARAGAPTAASTPRGPQQREASPDEAGAFTLRNLEPGVYRVAARPLDENFYAHSVQLPPTTPPAAKAGAQAAGRAADLLNISSGQQLSGLAVRLVAGAAAVAGRVVGTDAGTQLPASGTLRVHLVPAERARAEEILRYAETAPAPDGTFAFKNLAPGRYLLVVRPSEATDAAPPPAAWGADARARLRREAEAAAVTLDLQPCQRVNDFVLRYPPPAAK